MKFIASVWNTSDVWAGDKPVTTELLEEVAKRANQRESDVPIPVSVAFGTSEIGHAADFSVRDGKLLCIINPISDELVELVENGFVPTVGYSYGSDDPVEIFCIGLTRDPATKGTWIKLWPEGENKE